MSFLNWFLGKDDFRIPAGKPWVFHLVFKCFPGMAFSSKSDAGTTWEIHQSTMRWGSPTQGKKQKPWSVIPPSQKNIEWNHHPPGATGPGSGSSADPAIYCGL